MRDKKINILIVHIPKESFHFNDETSQFYLVWS